jgi:predicted SAM-dependent methyltransferase
MKLNLGCGGNYKRNFFNVDAFDSSIADKIMDAADLKLEDNSVEEILASQLIEHLGIAGSIYALSECFRVLRPNGKLIIETPDIRASFEKYLKGNRETRKNILPWIYGVDMPGMQHRFCFPKDLLEEILEKCGFVNIKKEYLEFDEYQPILKMMCQKPKHHRLFQVITTFRKQLTKKKLVDLDNQIPTLEKEKLIEFFIIKIKHFVESNDNKIIEELAMEGAICSPKITSIFLQEMVKQNIISKQLCENYFDILKQLNELEFPNVLLNNLIQQSNFVGKQEELFDAVCDFGRKNIKKLLFGSEREKNLVIDGLSKNLKKIDFFSQKLIMLKAYRLFQEGVKEFNICNYKEAVNKFKDSANLYRDQILTYWNLGRLLMLQGNVKEAIYNYKNALGLLKVIDYKNKTLIKKLIKQELDGCFPEGYREPVVSVERNLKDE